MSALPTAEQFRAIRSTAKRVVVAAGPGSGKTETLVRAIVRQMETGIPAYEIAVLTYTNAAARELEDRIAGCEMDSRIPNADPSLPPWRLGFIGTLHAFALRQIRYGDPAQAGRKLSVISEESSSAMLEAKAKALKVKEPVKDLLSLKRAGLPTYDGGNEGMAVVAIRSHLSDLRNAGLLDLDEILPELSRQLGGSRLQLFRPFRALFVDEVQDSSRLDWTIYHALPVEKKFFAGDPDQAIFGFRGGDTRGMKEALQFPGAELVKLEQNFRSGDTICLCAQTLIEKNTERIAKETLGSRRGSSVDTIDDCANEGEEIAEVSRRIRSMFEIHSIDYSDMAVLCRTNGIAAEFAKGLDALEIPVSRTERPDLPKDWPLARSALEFLAAPDNDVLASLYLTELELAKAPDRDRRSIARLVRSLGVNSSAQGVSLNEHLPALNELEYETASDAVARISTMAKVSKESAMLLSEKLREIDPEAPVSALVLAISGASPNPPAEPEGVRVLTIHAAKGREFDCVFIVGFEEESIPGRNGEGPELEEERRLAYVAITRARYHVCFSYALSRATPWGEIVKRTPSRFLKEMVS